MKLNTRGRYAVMAVVDLGLHGQDAAGQFRPISLADIADRQEISQAYLEQLFCSLRKSGLLNSVRGPGGGYVLARPANKMTVGDVVMAVDESLQITRCSEITACLSANTQCKTHELWDALSLNIQQFLNNITIQDVCNGDISRL